MQGQVASSIPRPVLLCGGALLGPQRRNGLQAFGSRASVREEGRPAGLGWVSEQEKGTQWCPQTWGKAEPCHPAAEAWDVSPPQLLGLGALGLGGGGAAGRAGDGG